MTYFFRIVLGKKFPFTSETEDMFVVVLDDDDVVIVVVAHSGWAGVSEDNLKPVKRQRKNNNLKGTGRLILK